MDNLIGVSRKSRFFKIIKPPDPCLNYQIRHVNRLVLAAEKSNATIIDIGSGGRRLAKRVINIDIDAFDHIDVISDAGSLPLKNNSVDLALITAVLEHVKHPREVVAEVHRILKPNGRVC
jgi:ubiquinone/menaquinone biosynthesis C-methylase UbiE